MLEPDGRTNQAANPPGGTQVREDLRPILHQLNNVFASILSNLDLALSHEGRATIRDYLMQAKESAHKGASAISDPGLWGLSPGGGAAVASGATGGALKSPTKRSYSGTERILLADDDPAIRMLLRAVLAFRGYKIVEASNGEEAIKLFPERGPFDLVILDLIMPKMDGQKALDGIRALQPGIRAIALSGLPSREMEKQAQQEGGRTFNAHLQKPFENDDLLRLVRQVLDRVTAPA